MAKKSFKDYTPEQRWKLQRRIIRLDKSPEMQQWLAQAGQFYVREKPYFDEALKYHKAHQIIYETHGLQSYEEWKENNPISPKAREWVDRIERMELEDRAKLAAKFLLGRQQGATANATKHIHQLAQDNRSLSAKQLFAKADKSIIGDMAEGTFGNHVIDARKKYPKEKKAKK